MKQFAVIQVNCGTDLSAAELLLFLDLTVIYLFSEADQPGEVHKCMIQVAPCLTGSGKADDTFLVFGIGDTDVSCLSPYLIMDDIDAGRLALIERSTVLGYHSFS